MVIPAMGQFKKHRNSRLVYFIIFFPSNYVLRIILGLPFALFFPGYTLTALLFPKKEGIGSVERAGVSIGISIVVTVLVGLIFNYTPLGMNQELIMYSIAFFILITSIIAWLRRRRLPESEQFSIELPLTLPGGDKTTLDRVLSIILIVVAVLGVLGTIGYALFQPRVTGERFTDFYIVGLEGKAESYPKELKVGEEGKVIVGIVNHEQETVNYRVEVRIDRVKSNEVETVVLGHDEKWEGEIGFVPEVAGGNQKVEFLLYKEGQNEVYQSLHLWLDVPG